jgi:hypothetical protein
VPARTFFYVGGKLVRLRVCRFNQNCGLNLHIFFPTSNLFRDFFFFSDGTFSQRSFKSQFPSLGKGHNNNNLSLALEQFIRRVRLVDAKFKVPTLHSFLASRFSFPQSSFLPTHQKRFLTSNALDDFDVSISSFSFSLKPSFSIYVLVRSPATVVS